MNSYSGLICVIFDKGGNVAIILILIILIAIILICIVHFASIFFVLNWCLLAESFCFFLPIFFLFLQEVFNGYFVVTTNVISDTASV